MIEEVQRKRLVKILTEVVKERISQQIQWGEENHTAEWMGILGEEFGELCKEFNNLYSDGHASKNLRTEAIQIAAVAIAIIECSERNGWISE